MTLTNRRIYRNLMGFLLLRFPTGSNESVAGLFAFGEPHICLWLRKGMDVVCRREKVKMTAYVG